MKTGHTHANHVIITSFCILTLVIITLVTCSEEGGNEVTPTPTPTQLNSFVVTIENVMGYDVEVTDEGTYLLCGQSWDDEYSTSTYLSEVDEQGIPLWRTDSDPSYSARSFAMTLTDEGMIGITGWFWGGSSVSSDAFLSLFDRQGQFLWSNDYGGSESDRASDLIFLPGSGFILTGYTSSYSPDEYEEVLLIRTDVQGSEQWIKNIGYHIDPICDWMVGRSCELTSDNAILVVGYAYFCNSGWHVYLIKTDLEGNEIWFTLLPDQWSLGYDQGYDVKETADGGIILCGFTTNDQSIAPDILLMKLDAAGNEIWRKTHGTDDEDLGVSVCQTSDGGYIVSGTVTRSSDDRDIILLKTDQNGEEQWLRTFDFGDREDGHTVKQTLDGGYIIIGNTYNTTADAHSMLLIKTDQHGQVTDL